MAKKKLNIIKPPVRLPSQIKHLHQYHFLHYTNELTELSTELKALTPRCEKLFGKFPISITESDRERLSIWFHSHREEKKSQLKFSKIFRKCIGKKSRDNTNPEWLDCLRENDEDLQQIYRDEENIKSAVYQYVENLPEETLDFFREFFASNYTKPKESLDILDLQHSFWRLTTDSFWKNNENYRRQINMEVSKLDPLIKFQNDFDLLLNKFYLEKDWLEESVFRAIWNGTGKLQMNSSFMEFIPEEVISEIETGLMRPQSESFFPEVDIPEPNPFTYNENYCIYFPFSDYEEKAVKAYRQHLHDYFKIIKESLKNHGYKEPRGDKYDYESLKRLICWNNSNFEDLWEIIPDIPEFEKVDTNNEIQRNSTVDKLRKSFKDFEKLDLPVRPYGRKRN